MEAEQKTLQPVLVLACAQPKFFHVFNKKGVSLGSYPDFTQLDEVLKANNFWIVPSNSYLGENILLRIKQNYNGNLP